RHNTGLFQEAAEEMDQALASEPLTLMVLQDQWWSHHQQYFHQYADQYKPKDAHHLTYALQKLDLFYHVVLLRYFCEVLNRRQIVGKEMIFEDLETRIAPFIQKDNPHVVIAAYSRLAGVLEDPQN